jgi:hypothetical protein
MSAAVRQGRTLGDSSKHRVFRRLGPISTKKKIVIDVLGLQGKYRGTSPRRPVESAWPAVARRDGGRGGHSALLTGQDRDGQCARERGQCFRFMRSASRAAVAGFPQDLALTTTQLAPLPFVSQSAHVGPCTSGQAPSAADWAAVSGPLAGAGGPWNSFFPWPPPSPFRLPNPSWWCPVLDLRFGRHPEISGKGVCHPPHLKVPAGNGQPKAAEVACLSPVTPTLFCLTSHASPPHSGTGHPTGKPCIAGEYQLPLKRAARLAAITLDLVLVT